MRRRKQPKCCIKRYVGPGSAPKTTISQLPDSLLTEILSHLPTKDAVRTSSLSTRWKSVWTFISNLDLDTDEFPDYSLEKFMDRFIDMCMENNRSLDELRLNICSDEYDEFTVMSWIDFLAIRKLKYLDVECDLDLERGCLKVIPFSLYVCKTLLFLRLHRVSLGSFESVSLPLVQSMYLESNVYANEASLESLISSCPVPYDLSVVRRVDDNVGTIRVISQTLTSLSVGYEDEDEYEENIDPTRRSSGFLIDAPNLVYLTFKNEVSKSKIISNLDSLVEVEFDGKFGGRDPYRDVMAIYPILHPNLDEFDSPTDRNFIIGLSNVEDMIISHTAMEFFYIYMRVESLPKLYYLSSLKASFVSLGLNLLPKFLECCPNLKSFKLDLIIPRNLIFRISLSSVPECMSSSLEIVEITSVFKGRRFEFDVAKYFLQKSSLLKKLVVHFDSSKQKGSFGFLRDLRALPRLSSMCEIVCASGLTG